MVERATVPASVEEEPSPPALPASGGGGDGAASSDTAASSPFAASGPPGALAGFSPPFDELPDEQAHAVAAARATHPTPHPLAVRTALSLARSPATAPEAHCLYSVARWQSGSSS